MARDVSEQAWSVRRWPGATTATGTTDPLVSPEAQGVGDIEPQRLIQASWSAAGNRLLFDAGVALHAYGWGNGERNGNNRSLPRVVDIGASFGRTITYRSQDWNDNDASTTAWHGTISSAASSDAQGDCDQLKHR